MKTGAIWWRVSRDNQQEISPDTQIGEALALAQAEGYVVPEENILGADWHSLSVWDSPPMEQLKELIRTQVIQGVFMYEPDRAPSKPAHRLLFRALCQEHGVSIRCRHGQIPDGDMGEVMEFLSAWAKEKQVHRAQQGAKDGIRDRARLKGLPTSTGRQPLGYAWDSTRTRLQPTSDWPHAEFICRAALDGMTVRKISQALYRRGIPSKEGNSWWRPQTIHTMLTNPIYGGRYYALRHESVQPKTRRVESYGKTSNRRIPLEKAFYMSNVIVESPPLTWEEWLRLQDRLKTNKLQSQRHAKRDYLMRGLVVCDTHHRHYHGKANHGGSSYNCPAYREPGAGRCARPYLSGRELEERVKAVCREVLSNPEIIEREIQGRAGKVGPTLESLQKSLATLDARENRSQNTEANLLMERAMGNGSPEAFQRCMAKIKADRAWISEERQRLQAQLDTIHQKETTLLGLARVRERLAAKLDSATNEDWRLIFNALAVEVHITEEMGVEIRMEIPLEKPLEQPTIVSTRPRA